MDEGDVMAKATDVGSGGSRNIPTRKTKKPKKQPSKGEQHVAQRRHAAALRTAANKVNYHGGLNAASIRNDGTLSATEKAHLLKLLRRRATAKQQREG